MIETLPPEVPGGVASALGTLRHALADPLSAAGVKLELLERRLAEAPSTGSALADRVRGAKADLASAGRLIDLLPRLASIVGETAQDGSLVELCRVAGVELGEDPATPGRLLLRRHATIDALRSLVWFLRSRDTSGRSPHAHLETTPDRVSLRIDTVGGVGAGDLERLFHLPRGEERAGDLFLARAAIETDGGTLQLVEREGTLVALLSWPWPATPGTGGADL